MTDAELAILSIVAEGSIYGYAIQTIIDRRGLRDWTNIGVSSMYYVLEKLERQQLIASNASDQTDGPSRRKYHITSAGTGVLQTAVADLLSTPHDTVNGFDLGLANLPVLRTSQIRAAFTAYHHELHTLVTQTRARQQQLHEARAPFHVRAMFDHRLALLEADLAWVQRFIKEWEAQALPDVPCESPAPVEVPRMKQVILPHDPDSPHRAATRPLKQSPAIEPPIPHAISPADTAISNKTPLASHPPEPPRDSPDEPDIAEE